MALNTVLLVLTLLAVAGIAVFAVADYWLFLHGRKTFSKWSGEVYDRWKDFPAFWIVLGASLGFTAGLVLGFILGHLFWPI